LHERGRLNKQERRQGHAVGDQVRSEWMGRGPQGRAVGDQLQVRACPSIFTKHHEARRAEEWVIGSKLNGEGTRPAGLRSG